MESFARVPPHSLNTLRKGACWCSAGANYRIPNGQVVKLRHVSGLLPTVDTGRFCTLFSPVIEFGATEGTPEMAIGGVDVCATRRVRDVRSDERRAVEFPVDDSKVVLVWAVPKDVSPPSEKTVGVGRIGAEYGAVGPSDTLSNGSVPCVKPRCAPAGLAGRASTIPTYSPPH